MKDGDKIRIKLTEVSVKELNRRSPLVRWPSMFREEFNLGDGEVTEETIVDAVCRGDMGEKGIRFLSHGQESKTFWYANDHTHLFEVMEEEPSCI